MIPSLAAECRIITTRSGGAGGQNVNKVETAVILYFGVQASQLLTDEQKGRLLTVLHNRINKEGEVVIRAQTHRTQSENKSEALKRLQALITSALQKKKARIATRIPKGIQEKRLKQKKLTGERKADRRSGRMGDWQ